MGAESGSNYFHGYASDEQRRLVRQAEYRRRTLIPLGPAYRSGERVPEVGCAACRSAN